MSKIPSLSSIRVAKPCNEAWEEMRGNEAVRFCSHCEKNVNFISAMTRKEARRLVRASGGNLCVRYVEHPETKEPLFLPPLYNISRRAPAMAAGVLGATLSLASTGIAQGSPVREIVAIERPADEKEGSIRKTAVGNSRIAGVITDAMGAVVPGTKIKLRNANGEFEETHVSSFDGSFEFKNLPAGNYSIELKADGFRDQNVTSIALDEDSDWFRTLSMDIGVVLAGVVAVSYEVEFKNDLSRAVYSEELDDVLELLTRGADPNEEEESGETPLFISVADGTTEIARALINFGARADARNKKGENALFRADEDTPAELVELLLEHGASIDIENEEGETPLFAAIMNGSTEVIKMLVRLGSDVNVKNKDGFTALMAAAENSTVEIMRLLLENGADSRAVENDGWTVLMHAAYEDDIEKVRLILFAGADVNARNQKGETAWDITDDEDVRALLVGFGATPGTSRPSDDNDEDTDGKG